MFTGRKLYVCRDFRKTGRSKGGQHFRAHHRDWQDEWWNHPVTGIYFPKQDSLAMFPASCPLPTLLGHLCHKETVSLKKSCNLVTFKCEMRWMKTFAWMGVVTPLCNGILHPSCVFVVQSDQSFWWVWRCENIPWKSYKWREESEGYDPDTRGLLHCFCQMWL